jgi:hypothetical protein
MLLDGTAEAKPGRKLRVEEGRVSRSRSRCCTMSSAVNHETCPSRRRNSMARAFEERKDFVQSGSKEGARSSQRVDFRYKWGSFIGSGRPEMLASGAPRVVCRICIAGLKRTGHRSCKTGATADSGCISTLELPFVAPEGERRISESKILARVERHRKRTEEEQVALVDKDSTSRGDIA